jgi:hypothetical protein
VPGRLGVAYERAEGIQGFTSLKGPHHADIMELTTLLSDADLRKLKERQPNVIPFARP